MGYLREFMLKKGNTKRSSLAVREKQLPTNSYELLLLFPQFLLQRAHHLTVVAQVVAQTVAAILADKHV